MSQRPSRSSAADQVKYPPGVGARVPSSQRPMRPLEWAVLGHLAIFFVGTTWAFGGGAEWLRPRLAWWGSIGVLLTLAAVSDRTTRSDGWRRTLGWLWPFAAFNAFVLAGCLNPSFREVKFDAEVLLVNSGGRPGLPSSARPVLGLHALWLFDAIWLSCFNVALVVRRRRALRGLLVLATANALALAIFGTVQKLVHARGLFFGLVASPQPYFFASFIYHNHWGSFAVLMMAACLGLVWHFARREASRDFFHSPAFAWLVAVFLLAVTVPLSTSRSCSVLTLLLLGGAWLHWIGRLVQHRRHFRESVSVPFAGAVLAVAVVAAGTWFVARESIAMRAATTRNQLTEMLARGSVGARAELYRDTWTMAQAKPWFGWGMGSYPHVFTLYNTRTSPVDRLPVFYRDAHSDWLQALAEHGYVGSSLLALCALVPLSGLRRRHFASAVTCYLLAGCGLILLYAWIEFPFGNVAVVLSWWLCFFCAVQYGRLHDRAPSDPLARETPATASKPAPPCAAAA